MQKFIYFLSLGSDLYVESEIWQCKCKCEHLLVFQEKEVARKPDLGLRFYYWMASMIWHLNYLNLRRFVGSCRPLQQTGKEAPGFCAHCLGELAVRGRGLTLITVLCFTGTAEQRGEFQPKSFKSTQHLASARLLSFTGLQAQAMEGDCIILGTHFVWKCSQDEALSSLIYLREIQVQIACLSALKHGVSWGRFDYSGDCPNLLLCFKSYLPVSLSSPGIRTWL